MATSRWAVRRMSNTDNRLYVETPCSADTVQRLSGVAANNTTLMVSSRCLIGNHWRAPETIALFAVILMNFPPALSPPDEPIDPAGVLNWRRPG